MLIQARQLVNDASIRRDDSRRVVTYFHVELERHAIVLADGLSCESYLESGNRGQFDDGGSVVALDPDQGRRDDPLACAPLVTDGAIVEPIWRRLAERAGPHVSGVPSRTTTGDADLRLVLPTGRVLRPEPVGRDGRHVFRLGAAAPRQVRLRSRRSAPSDIRPWIDDRRQLGVAVAGIEVLTGAGESAMATIPVDDPSLSVGWWRRRRMRPAVGAGPTATRCSPCRPASCASTWSSPRQPRILSPAARSRTRRSSDRAAAPDQGLSRPARQPRPIWRPTPDARILPTVRLLRLLRRSLAVVGGLILLAAAIVAGALWATLPRADQTAEIPGLSAPVDIGFDADGVPRIQARNATDAAAALGFVHARDRMFQMEMLRRAASGRLSEVAGPATLGLDKMMRTLGIRRRAVEQVPNLAPETRAMLDAYAAGVNAWIALRGRFAGAEFLALGAPEPWTPADSLLWGKTLALWLSGNWQAELSRQRLAGKLPPGMIEQLWPRRDPPASPSAARQNPELARLAALLQAALPRFPDPFTLPDEASNEWAVAGARTVSGAPLLAGDPHLGFSMPGIWYLARIDTPDGVLAGATSPGVPFLVIGRNSNIAWTFTTTGADVGGHLHRNRGPRRPGQYQIPRRTQRPFDDAGRTDQGPCAASLM